MKKNSIIITSLILASGIATLALLLSTHNFLVAKAGEYEQGSITFVKGGKDVTFTLGLPDSYDSFYPVLTGKTASGYPMSTHENTYMYVGDTANLTTTGDYFFTYTCGYNGDFASITIFFDLWYKASLNTTNSYMEIKEGNSTRYEDFVRYNSDTNLYYSQSNIHTAVKDVTFSLVSIYLEFTCSN